MVESGHIIIGGYDHLGRRIAAELSARGYQVVIIELTGSDSLTVPVGGRLIIGDMRDAEVLRAAQVETAHCLLAVTGDDRTNLETALAAREIAPDIRVIVRLFDQTLGRGIENTFKVQALSASFLAQPAYIAAAADNAVMASFDVDGQQLNIFRTGSAVAGGVGITKAGDDLTLCTADDPTSHCLYATLSELGKSIGGVRVGNIFSSVAKQYIAAINPRRIWHGLRDTWRQTSVIGRRVVATLLLVSLISVLVFATIGKMSPLDALYFVVTTLTTTGYGDISLKDAPPLLKIYGILMMLGGAALLATVYAIIADVVLTARIEYLLGRRAVTMSDHIVVVGLGKVGYRVAQSLHALGFPVVAVEANEDSDRVSAARLTMPVIIGNAARTSVLQKTGIERARTILALTDDPMLNLSVVLHTRNFNPAIRAIVRSSTESRFDGRLHNLNLTAEISTSVIAAPVFANAAIYPGVEGSFSYAGEDILVIRYSVADGSPLNELTAAAVGTRFGAAVTLVAESASSPYLLATPQIALKSGNVAILLVTSTKMAGFMI